MAQRKGHDFDDGQVAEFKMVWNQWNTDSNEVLDGKELRVALEQLGVGPDQFDDIVRRSNLSMAGLTFEDFLIVLWAADEEMRKSGLDISDAVRHQIALIGISTASGGKKTYSQSEVSAFANHLNICLLGNEEVAYLLPVEPEEMDLMTKVADGVLLAAFINVIEADTIDFRAVNNKKAVGALNQFQVIENHNLNIAAAQAIGVRVTNVSAEELRDAPKNPILVLGLMWQMVRMQLLGKINLMSCPELIKLLEDGEEMADLLALDPETLLKRWVNYHMKQQDYPRRISNFGGDLKDGKVYTVLMKSIAPEHGCNLGPLEWAEAKRRAQETLLNAKKLGVVPFLTAEDIVKGNSKFNMAFLAQLFNKAPGLGDLDEQQMKELAGLLDEDDFNDSREAKVFRLWMNSLGIKDFQVNHLFEDCHTGLVLLRVIDRIEPGLVNWKKAARNPTNKFKKVQNANYAVELGKARPLSFSLVNVGGTDIVDKSKKLILGFTWQLMRHHMLKMLASLGNGTPLSDQDVLDWCNGRIVDKKANGPQIKSFKDPAIATGLYFIHLVAAIEPDIVAWDLVTDANDEEEQRLNARYAISLARKIGAIIFVLPDDIMEVRSKMCMTFAAAVMVQALRK